MNINHSQVFIGEDINSISATPTVFELSIRKYTEIIQSNLLIQNFALGDELLEGSSSSVLFEESTDCCIYTGCIWKILQRIQFYKILFRKKSF